MRRTAFVSVLLLASLASPARGQSSVRTELDTTEVQVGDRITMTVTVDHPIGTQARIADSVAVAPFEVLTVSAPRVATEGEGMRSTFEVGLTVFELGELELPGIPVEVVDADGSVGIVETDRYGIEVVSVGVDDSGDIREIRGPLGIPLSSWVIALWVIGPVLLAALMYFLARRLRPRGEETRRPALGPPPRPAHEVALEALAALKASPLLERGQVKEYHIEASDILRTYVEERFRVDALEMTTREVLDGLAEAGADASFRVGLRTFLESCDLVKFAKARPDVEASRSALELGRRIILESAPAPPAEVEPEPSADAEERVASAVGPASAAAPVSEEA